MAKNSKQNQLDPDKEPMDINVVLREWEAILAHEGERHQRLQGVMRARQRVSSRMARRSLASAGLPPSRRRAVHAALSYVGTTEHPPNSNTGPHIDTWQANFGIHAQPWCGAFVGSMARLGGAHPTQRIVYCPYILEDARLGRNGLSHVVWERGQGFAALRKIAHTADLVLYDFATGGVIQHVGMLREPWRSGNLLTVEGNTSFGASGSQDNGGCVAMRVRPLGYVKAIVALKW